MREHAGQIAVGHKILENIQHLRMQQRRSGELTGRGRTSENKDSRANDGADSERRQRPRPQSLLQPAFRPFRVGDQFVNGLLGKELAGQKASFDSIDIGLPDERLVQPGKEAARLLARSLTSWLGREPPS